MVHVVDQTLLPCESLAGETKVNVSVMLFWYAVTTCDTGGHPLMLTWDRGVKISLLFIIINCWVMCIASYM